MRAHEAVAFTNSTDNKFYFRLQTKSIKGCVLQKLLRNPLPTAIPQELPLCSPDIWCTLSFFFGIHERPLGFFATSRLFSDWPRRVLHFRIRILDDDLENVLRTRLQASSGGQDGRHSEKIQKPEDNAMFTSVDQSTCCRDTNVRLWSVVSNMMVSSGLAEAETLRVDVTCAAGHVIAAT